LGVEEKDKETIQLKSEGRREGKRRQYRLRQGQLLKTLRKERGF